MSEKKMFIVYDGRAISGDTDDAAVLVADDTLREARKDARMFARDYGEVAIYEYDVNGTELVNERFVERVSR